MSSNLPLLPGLLADVEKAEAVELPGLPGIEATMHPASQPHTIQAQPLSAPGPDQPSTAFDRWLRRELTRLYDPVLNEPVPEHLCRLLDAALRGDTGRH